MTNIKRIRGSFRDPSGFVFIRDGTVYRQVNPGYQANYDHLLGSGLYADLTERQLLVPHIETDSPAPGSQEAYKVLKPLQIPFISYPYEWAFSQLKDAALLTLEVQKRALSRGMVLKDASAYNIQFHRGKAILIDTLSFERYQDGEAWVAYKQFCQHFLAPLLLMSRKDIRLSQLLRVHIDGIPLDLAAAIAPKTTYRQLGVLMHLHLHARAQQRYRDGSRADGSLGRKRISMGSLLQIADSLRGTIRGLRWRHDATDWSDYYEGDSYQVAAFRHKLELVAEYLDLIQPACVWDLGANTGEFSRLASGAGAFTVSADNDPGVVEANYLKAKRDQESNLLPLLLDLVNPSGAIGWANGERLSLAERCNADCLLALALIHHLAISNNVPLHSVAEFFAALAEWLVIEFVPKRDKQVQKLLRSRADIFEGYSQEGFEASFGEVYEIVKSSPLRQSERVLYLMRRRKT